MSDSGESAGTLFRAGRLNDAVTAAGAAVRKAPADLGARVLLAEMLLFAGNFERADVILDAAAVVDPQAAVVVAEFRQLLRAATARRQLRLDGRVPEFLGLPTPALAAMLEACVALRAGDTATAAALAARAEAMRPRVAGAASDQAFDDFRDGDDMKAGFFEVLTTTGKYFWIPTERVETVEFHPPKRPRDLFWRRASMTVREGPEGDVYIPVIYDCADPALSDTLKLGHETDWQPQADGLVTGAGQASFMAGEVLLPVMELTSLRFAPA
ncbi:MAG: type VI secretion system accessory protein TagJ [Acetobacteraceae bacterium]|nr:tetratricopeptide repeat protein [Pseudomonadota bacterium]